MQTPNSADDERSLIYDPKLLKAAHEHYRLTGWYANVRYAEEVAKTEAMIDDLRVLRELKPPKGDSDAE